MEFRLEGHLEFSKDLDFLKPKLPEMVAKKINPVLFRKGVPTKREGSKLTKWGIIGNRLTVTIEGTTYLRPHDALLRLRTFLGERLGKEHQIGVREIFIKDYEIVYKPEKRPKARVEVKVPWVKEVKEKDNELWIKLQDLDSTAIEDRYVERILKRVEDKISAQYVAGKKIERVVKRGKRRLRRYKLKRDLTEEALKRGWAKEFPVRGVWMFMPPMVALIKALEKLVMERIARPMHFKEMLLPRLIPLEVQYRKGQLAGIPNEMYWVCPPISRDPRTFEEISDFIEVTGGKVPEELLVTKLKPPIATLAYAQCEPWYEIFRGEILDLDELPWKFVDRFGPTWRYEAGGLKGLERYTEFYRIELAWIGSVEDVTSIRDKVLKRAIELADKTLDLEWRVDAVIPVYLEHAGPGKEEREEIVKTYDLTIMLPFGTVSRPEEKELEISNFSVHTDFYAKRFGWKEKNGRTIWSGCSGIGPFRWAYVFLARWGFNFDEWPEEIRKTIEKLYGKMPEVPKMVSWP